MREPIGRGASPRQDGRCVHQWQRLPETGQVVCRYCDAEQPRCPHEWRWVPAVRRWSCRVCAAQRPDG